MLIEMSVLPIEIQQKIESIGKSEILSFVKNGKVITSFVPKMTHAVEEPSVYDLLMSQTYPDVSEVDLELPARTLPPTHRLEVFD